jgi:hypothetical protein
VSEALIRRGLRVGDRHPVVVEVRQRLGAAGVVANYTVADPQVFDTGLKTLVEVFQKRRGLAVDGIVGPNTWKALGGTLSAQPTTPTTGTATPGVTPGSALAPPPPEAPGTGPNPLIFLGLGVAAVGGWMLWKNRKPGGMVDSLSGMFSGPVDDPKVLRRIRPTITRAGRVIEAEADDGDGDDDDDETPAEREARLVKQRASAARRRERAREADREWELEQVRAAARMRPESRIDERALRERTQRLIEAGVGPAAAAAQAARELVVDPIFSTVVPMEERNRGAMKARLQVEAERMVPLPDDATAREKAAVMAERARVYERMLRTGLGPTANITKATASAGRKDVARGVPGMLHITSNRPESSGPRDVGIRDRPIVEVFPEGVRAAIAPPLGPRAGSASSIELIGRGGLAAARRVYLTPSEVERYKTDRAFREQTKDRVKAMAVESGQSVELHASGPVSSLASRTLWQYDPGRRKALSGFRDVVTDSLLDQPADLAKRGRCVEAASALIRRRGLARTSREAEILKRAVEFVSYRCPKELEEAVTEARLIGPAVGTGVRTIQYGPEGAVPLSPRAKAEMKAAAIMTVKKLAQEGGMTKELTPEERAELIAVRRFKQKTNRLVGKKQSGGQRSAEIIYPPDGGAPYTLTPFVQREKRADGTIVERQKMKKRPVSEKFLQRVRPKVRRGATRG